MHIKVGSSIILICGFTLGLLFLFIFPLYAGISLSPPRLLNSNTHPGSRIALPITHSLMGEHSALSERTPLSVTSSITPDIFSALSSLPLTFLFSPSTDLFFPLIQSPSPALPVQPYPAHRANEQSPNVFLSWTTLEPNTIQLHYEVYLSANDVQAQPLIAQVLSVPYLDPPTFAMDTQYYWYVVTIDTTGNRITGPVWTFRTEPENDLLESNAMILIPSGEFWMGCDAANDRCISDRTHREQPLHLVYLDAYEIDKYEVTNEGYRACVDVQVCRAPRKSSSPGRDSYFDNPEYDNYPVMYVSWSDAQTYCGWHGKRLPTEAEWEKAARGPMDTRIWPWGNEEATCERANHRVHCGSVTTPVGAYPSGASPYGLMDMSGNVFEWVADKYDAAYYNNTPYANPQGPDISRPDLEKPPVAPPLFYYTIRGGSYHDNWWYSRVAHRHWGHHGDAPNGDAPYFRSFRVGFRCARSVSE